jgi:hypothetical protein
MRSLPSPTGYPDYLSGPDRGEYGFAFLPAFAAAVPTWAWLTGATAATAATAGTVYYMTGAGGSSDVSSLTPFWGVTQKASVWAPTSGDANNFIAKWAQDDWRIDRTLSRSSELKRYQDATIKTFPYSDAGLQEALKYAQQKAGKSSSSSSSSSSTALPSPYVPALTPAPSPSAGPTTGTSLTDQPWFWPATIGGTIAVGALVWAFLPSQSRPKVVVKQAAARFTGF